MIINAGALEMLAGREGAAARERVAAELLVHAGAPRPGRAPVVPGRDRGGDLLEVGERHPVGDEARRPMGDRRSHACILRHGPSSPLTVVCDAYGAPRPA